MKRLMKLSALSLVCAAFGCVTLYGQDFELPKPSPEHKMLMEDVGEWDVEVKAWGDPSGEPEVSKATEVTKKFGEFFTQSQFKGSFGGVPFRGTGLMGYDPVKKKYYGTWADSMLPHVTTLEGTYDEKSKLFTFVTKGVGMDGKPSTGKITIHRKSKDSHVFKMYAKMGDEMVQQVEMKYTRKK